MTNTMRNSELRSMTELAETIQGRNDQRPKRPGTLRSAEFKKMAPPLKMPNWPMSCIPVSRSQYAKYVNLIKPLHDLMLQKFWMDVEDFHKKRWGHGAYPPEYIEYEQNKELQKEVTQDKMMNVYGKMIVRSVIFENIEITSLIFENIEISLRFSCDIKLLSSRHHLETRFCLTFFLF